MSTSRDILIENATKLFLEKGFAAVGTKELCSVSSMNKGTFYHFFPSKAELLVSVIEKYTDEISKAFYEIARSEMTPQDKLSALFSVPKEANLAWKANHGYAPGCLVGNMSLEFSASDEAVRASIRMSIDKWCQPIAKIIDELIECGEIPKINKLKAAEAVIALMQGGLVLAKTMNDPEKISFLSSGALLHLKSLA